MTRQAMAAPLRGGLYWGEGTSVCRPLGASMPGIFINYRRDDAPGVAGRLYDHLARKFSRGSLFIDVDAIKPGLDFVKQLDAQVSQCDAVLAIIGPHWLTAADSKGKRRLDDTHDYVRIEIASALKRDIPVIPVLIDGAEMPAEGDLPEDLASLARRHALELRHTRFASDADAVVTALHTVLPKTKKSWALPLAAAAVVGVDRHRRRGLVVRAPDAPTAQTAEAHLHAGPDTGSPGAQAEEARRDRRGLLPSQHNYGAACATRTSPTSSNLKSRPGTVGRRRQADKFLGSRSRSAIQSTA